MLLATAAANWLALREGEEGAAAPELSKHSFTGLHGISSRRGRVVAARCLAFTPPASAPTSAAPSAPTSPQRREAEARPRGRLLPPRALEELSAARPSSHAELPPSGSRVRSLLQKLEAAAGQLRLSCNEERLEEVRRRLRPQASAPARGAHGEEGAAKQPALASYASLQGRCWLPAAGRPELSDLSCRLSIDCSAASMTERSSSASAGSERSDDCGSGCGSGSTSASNSIGGLDIESRWGVATSSGWRGSSSQQLSKLCTTSCDVGDTSIGGGCSSSASSPPAARLPSCHSWRSTCLRQPLPARTRDGGDSRVAAADCEVPCAPHSQSVGPSSAGCRGSGWACTAQDGDGCPVVSGQEAKPVTAVPACGRAPSTAAFPATAASVSILEASASPDTLARQHMCSTTEGTWYGDGAGWEAQRASTLDEETARAAAGSLAAAPHRPKALCLSTAPITFPGNLGCCTPTRHTPSAFGVPSRHGAGGQGSPLSASSPTHSTPPALLEPIFQALGPKAAPAAPMPTAPPQGLKRSSTSGSDVEDGSSSAAALNSAAPQRGAADVAGGTAGAGAATPARQPSVGRRRRAEAVPVLEPHDLFLAQLLASPQSPAPPALASRGTGGSSLWTWGRTLAGLGRRRNLWGAADSKDAAGAGAAEATAGAERLDAGSAAAAQPSGRGDPTEDLLPRFGSEARFVMKPRGGSAGMQPSNANHGGDGQGTTHVLGRAASMSSAHSAAPSGPDTMAVHRQLQSAAAKRRLGAGLSGSPTPQHPLLERAQQPAQPQRSWRGWSFRAPQRFAALAGDSTALQYDLDVLRELEQGWSSQCAMQ